MAKQTNITITAASRKKKPAPKQGKEDRRGPFSRIDDEPIVGDNPPVLIVTYFDLSFAQHTKAYSIKTPALPKEPKPVADHLFNLLAREKTIAFPQAQGYAFVAGLAAYSLAKPRAPVQTSTTAPGFGESFTLEEGVLYLVGEATIASVDVSDPAAIAMIHTYDAVADFTAKQRYMGSPAVLNSRLYVASVPDRGGVSGGDSEPNAWLATYDFDNPAAATQIHTIALEDASGWNSQADQKPPVILGTGVLYLSHVKKDAPDPGNTYTTQLKTYTLTNPDAPAQVHSINVDVSGPVSGFFANPAHEYHKLWINKAKTRLFLLTCQQTLNGTLWMYDVGTDPETPALLDSVPFVFDQGFAQSSVYPSDTGFVYVGTFDPTPAIEVYDYRADTFVLANTVTIPAESQAYLVYALDNKGFPQ